MAFTADAAFDRSAFRRVVGFQRPRCITLWDPVLLVGAGSSYPAPRPAFDIGAFNHADATTEIEFEAPTPFETEAYAKRWLTNLGSGNHTIEVRANAESANLAYLVDADIIAERLGWTCTST